MAHQHGMTLVVSLIMLVVITLFVLSAIRLSTANLRTVGNAQARNEAAAASQRAIVDLLSSPAAVTSPGTGHGFAGSGDLTVAPGDDGGIGLFRSGDGLEGG